MDRWRQILQYWSVTSSAVIMALENVQLICGVIKHNNDKERIILTNIPKRYYEMDIVKDNESTVVAPIDPSPFIISVP